MGRCSYKLDQRWIHPASFSFLHTVLLNIFNDYFIKCKLYCTLKQIWYHTVPLNYNFIFTRVYTRGTTQYFACKMLKFPVENIISTRRDAWHFHETCGISTRRVAFPRDETWHFHETRRLHATWSWSTKHREKPTSEQREIFCDYVYTGT